MRTYNNASGHSVYTPFETANVLATNNAATNGANLQSAINSLNLGSGGVLWGSNAYETSPFILKNNVSIKGTNMTGFKGAAPVGGRTQPATASTTPGMAYFIIRNQSTPFLRVQTQASVEDFGFYYPEQSYDLVANIKAYPPAITSESGYHGQLYFRNLNFVGEYTAFDFYTGVGTTSDGADIKIEGCYGYPLSGRFIAMKKILDIPRIRDCHVGPGQGIMFRGGYYSGTSAFTKEIIEHVIANGLPTYDIDFADQFKISGCFAYAVNTAFRIKDSYGTLTDCSADIVRVGLDLQPNEYRKTIQVISFTGIPSGGAGTSTRNMIQASGTGTINLHGVSAHLGQAHIVDSSIADPNANAFIQLNGAGQIHLKVFGADCKSPTYKFQHEIQKNNTNAATKITVFGLDIENAVNRYTPAVA